MPHHLSKWNEDMCRVKGLPHDFATYTPEAFAALVLEIFPSSAEDLCFQSSAAEPAPDAQWRNT